MKTLLSLVLLITCLLFVGYTADCSDQMKETKAKYGVAEEINTYNSSGYHNVDWWYWSKGFQYSFT